MKQNVDVWYESVVMKKSKSFIYNRYMKQHTT